MAHITAKTRPLGLIGHPVHHSRSPEMINAALQEQNLPYVYLAFNLPPQSLSQSLKGMRLLNFKGFNVTVPHKIKVMEYVDEVDDYAREIGAVNTVVEREQKWIGTNTDGLGYLRSLQEEMNLDMREQNVVLLGAGGAARAVGYVLTRAGVPRITIVNRTRKKAEKLAEHLGQWGNDVQVCSLKEAKNVLKTATCFINSTSVGMHPHIDQMPIEEDWLHSNMVVSDLIYNPRETRLLQAARQRGAAIHNGMGMLLYQAVIAYELWTEQPAPVELMRQSLSKVLPGR